MASSPFNISKVKLHRITTFSQLFFSLNNKSNHIISLPRKLPPCRSRNLQLSVHRNDSPSSSSLSSSCGVSVSRNLCCYSQRNPEAEPRGEDDDEAIDPLWKFFSAITHRFTTPTKSEIPTDQFLSFLHAFSRRNVQAWGVFWYLMQVFGNSVEFIFKETLYDGLNIGVQWKFESEKSQFTLGKGINFYISHSYKGKAMIRNSEMLIKPFLHLLPFKLKIMASVEGLREGMGSFMALESENKLKKMFTILIALLAITAIFFLLRIPSFKLVFKLSHKP